MSDTSPARGNPAAFGRTTVLGIVVFGFIAFIALLYFIGVGDTGRDGNDGGAHAAAKGLNGYAGYAELLELEGYEVNISRSQAGFESNNLLVLTPPPYFDADDLAEVIENRTYVGPTLVILPKWLAGGFPPILPEEIEDEVEEGWVQLYSANAPSWVGDLPEPYAIEIEIDRESEQPSNWAGLGLRGKLPEAASMRLVSWRGSELTPLVVDRSGKALAVSFLRDDGFDAEYGEPVTFVIEPDLVNNYGLADAARAALAMAIIEETGYGDEYPVTFDVTLNGLGGSTNLLTLAFRPPFLAATLCLILAMMIVGWRAFRRFGPPVASGPEIAFGKERLVSNGAGLILRARRLKLLAAPYAALSARRIASRLGLSRPDPEAIDAALERRFPGEPPFSVRAAELRSAGKPNEILRAAKALKELEGKLAK